jgi:lipoate-protein ligase B
MSRYNSVRLEGLVNRLEKICWVVDLGLIPYGPSSDLQSRLVRARQLQAIPDVLLLCEHSHVITLGRNGKRDHLRAGERLLAQMNVEFHSTDRGGDITYHGPGQIVGYPIMDLTEHRRDVRWYVSQLEETIIRTAAEFGIEGKRSEGMHGVWVDTPAREEKLAALGVHLSRWVTSHGFAFNVATDLRYFDLIIPCGLTGKRVTSLERILGRVVSVRDVSARIVEHFGVVFDRAMVPVSRQKLEDALDVSQGSESLSDPAEKVVATARELAQY